MGLIGRAVGLVLGGGGGAAGGSAVAQTIGMFREGPEAAAAREAMLRMGAMEQFGREFAVPRRGWFDRLMDGVNRLPRPAMALGTLGLFVAAMVDPIWFAARMQGIALVPEPMWWLLGAIVSFYFGARHQTKGQEFRRSVAETMAQAGTVVSNIHSLEALARGAGAEPAAPALQAPAVPSPALDPAVSLEGYADANPALDEWRAAHG